MMTMPVCFFAGGFDFFGQQFEKKVEFRVDLAIAIVSFSAGIFQCVIPKATYVHLKFMKYIPQRLQDFLDTWRYLHGRVVFLDDIRHGIQRGTPI